MEVSVSSSYEHKSRLEARIRELIEEPVQARSGWFIPHQAFHD